METLFRVAVSNAISATLLAMVVACLGRVFHKRPAMMHGLWLLVLLKLITPPFYEISVDRGWNVRETEQVETVTVEATPLDVSRDLEVEAPWTDDTVPASPSHITFTAKPDTTLQTTGRLPMEVPPEGLRARLNAMMAWLSGAGWYLLASIWLLGSVGVAVIAARRIGRFQEVARFAKPVGLEVQELIDSLAERLSLSRSPEACWVTGKVSPMLWAVGVRPRLILPIELWKQLDDRQRATVILHELAHLRRGDHYVRFFELFVTLLFWWHPVLWWTRRALHEAEEQCCDAWVLWACPDSARRYAETLLDTIDFLDRSTRLDPVLASGFGSTEHLRRRLTMIMSGTTPRLRGLGGTLGALCLAGLLPLYPSWGQEAANSPDRQATTEQDPFENRVSETSPFGGRVDFVVNDATEPALTNPHAAKEHVANDGTKPASTYQRRANGLDELPPVDDDKVERPRFSQEELLRLLKEERKRELSKLHETVARLTNELKVKQREFDAASLRFRNLQIENGDITAPEMDPPTARLRAPALATNPARPSATTRTLRSARSESDPDSSPHNILPRPARPSAPANTLRSARSESDQQSGRTLPFAATPLTSGRSLQSSDTDRIERLEEMLQELNKEIKGLKKERASENPDPTLSPSEPKPKAKPDAGVPIHNS